MKPEQKGRWVKAPGAEGVAQFFVPDVNNPDFVGHIAQDEKHNFIGFAKDEVYRAANRELIEIVFPRLPQNFVQIDQATGTGLIPQLVSEMSLESQKRGRVIGIEPDSFAIKSAEENTPTNSHCEVLFIQGMGQDLLTLIDPELVESVDYVSIHDAIHEIPGNGEKEKVIKAGVTVLAPGGLYSLNSAFTSVAQTLPYGEWKADMLRTNKLKRDKSVNLAIEVLKPEDYVSLLTNQGLKIVHQDIKDVELSRQALEDISRYPEFVAGFFRDVIDQDEISLDEKSRMLIESLERRNVVSIPRKWFEVVAQKPYPKAA